MELLTIHLSPKQILVNAHVNLKDDRTDTDIAGIEAKIKEAEPKVDMIFLETAA